MARMTFPRFSFDLIYARPGQTVGACAPGRCAGASNWQRTICRCTQLTIEPGDAVRDALHQRGAIVLPDDDSAAEMYQATAGEAGRYGLTGSVRCPTTR